MTATPEPAEVTVLPEAGADEEAGLGYQQRLGAKLRAVRRARGLRLQDVEELSEGRFKAVVIGSYERGDRAISAHKLASLAAFYEVPVVELLPDEERSRRRSSENTLAVDLRRLREQSDDPELAPLLRLVRHVQWLRDDYNGQILSLRTDDLRTIAVSMGAPDDRLDAWLDERELLHR
ncbi:MAG: transcriptional regulator [Nitriliruptor sp.]|nr:MAG: transcriptional regulator [Nitriliruptor sp.]